MLLNTQQVRELNEIYATICRKYKSLSSESANLTTISRLTQDEATNLAELEVAQKRVKIESDYQSRCIAIERNANKRGMQNSSVTLEALERALIWKLEAIEAIENSVEKRTKKILADNEKLVLQNEKEKAMQRSRSLRDFATLSRAKLTVPFNVQELIDEELYQAYLAWCMNFPPAQAHLIVNANPIFVHNMGFTRRQQLYDTLYARRGV